MKHDATEYRRRAVAPVVLIFFLACSAYVSSIIGFSTEPKNPHRVTGHWHILVIAAGIGLFGVATALLILRRRLLSWWLLLALPVPAAIALDQATSI